MNVSLTPQLEAMIQEKVATGLYNSASEVIREALRLLEERDRINHIRFEELRKQVKRGIKQLEHGDWQEYDDESLGRFFEGINTRGRKRLAERKKNSTP